jgi:outer membrane beta-barrel protein
MVRLGAAVVLAATLAAPLGARAADGDDKADEKAADADAAKAGGDACIDEKVKADLFAKRRMRTTRDRLFQQTNRHEMTAWGGYYVSDTFDGVIVSAHLGDIPGVSHVPGLRSVPLPGVFGFAYAYHMTEDLAVEASGGYTKLTSTGGPELERTFAVLQNRPRRELLFDADLVFAPAHAKMRLGGSITHLDLYVVAGAGVVDSVLSSDLAANGGFGLKFFLGRAVAVRVDVRDHFYRQELLARKVFVNDVTTTLGLSLFLPLGE